MSVLYCLVLNLGPEKTEVSGTRIGLETMVEERQGTEAPTNDSWTRHGP